jgi:outer membrane protein assembly factor BamB
MQKSLAVLGLLAGVVAGTGGAPQAGSVLAASGDWPSYMVDANHTGFAAAESAITAATASRLHVHWTQASGATVFAQPVVAGGSIFWGSFDGYERASDLNGKLIWSTYLGRTSNPKCGRMLVGVASTPTYTSMLVGGQTTPVLFVGGGDASLYALNAATGAVIWRISLGAFRSAFIWDSPSLDDTGHVYVGVSSFFDCPLVQGKLVQLDEASGTVLHVFNTVPDGCIGGGVWGSPVIDAAAQKIYFATGNPSPPGSVCASPTPYAEALVEVNESDLSLVGSWQIPASQQIGDSDFGSTPNLFTAGSVSMVGVANKSGYYYAFQRDALTQGPVWFDRVADGTVDDIAPGAVGSGALIIAGSHTNIRGTPCYGSIRSVNPATGAYNWETCLPQKVIGAVSLAPGVAAIGLGAHFDAVDTSSGKVIFSYAGPAGWANGFRSSASISNGVIYVGNNNGVLYAFGL